MVPQLDYLLGYIMGFRAMIRGADLDDEDFGEDDHDEWYEMMVHPEEDEGTKRNEWDTEDEDEDGYEEIDVNIEKELYG
jgi:hypothetical protein